MDTTYPVRALLIDAAVGGFTSSLRAQSPLGQLLTHDETAVATPALADITEGIEVYDRLIHALGGDSLRSCEGAACNGWVEDHYPDGILKHRGYYQDGRLLVFKNYFPSGRTEREFKTTSNTKCLLRTFNDDGALRSEALYVSGDQLEYTDYHPNGQLRYKEVKHPDDPYYLVMDLFAENGTPISSLNLVDKKKVIFEQKEYWPDGKLSSSGRSQFNPRRFDTQRIGEWTFFDETGKAARTEQYIDGKVHEVAEVK